MSRSAVHGAGLMGVAQPYRGRGYPVPSTVELEAVQRKLNLFVVPMGDFSLTW